MLWIFEFSATFQNQAPGWIYLLNYNFETMTGLMKVLERYGLEIMSLLRDWWKSRCIEHNRSPCACSILCRVIY
jgi:hypothetical protein